MVRLAAVAGLGILLFAFPAHADTRGDCQGRVDVDRAIASCTQLIGSNANDYVGGSTGSDGSNPGLGGVTALSNGNYVVGSPNWFNNIGAATWGSSAMGGVSGEVATSGTSNVCAGPAGRSTRLISVLPSLLWICT